MKYPQYFTDEHFKQESAEVLNKKIQALIRAMTLEEKAELCHGGINPEIPGQVGNGGYIRGVGRLGIPEIRMYDGPAGVTSIYETTGLPAEEMLASTWSRELSYAFGQVTGRENKMISGNCQLGAEVDLVRTTHFNRTRDMLGEDPHLAGELAVPMVKGIQDQHVIAVLKHFAGYVVSANPANSPDTVIDEQTMHELYLTPFERAVRDGGAAGIMTAYNRINGPYAANSVPLLKDVLRGQWDYKGLVMCDWGGNHSFSLKNGLDIEMPVGAYNSTERLLRFIDSGKISEDDLNLAVEHILWAMGQAGYLSLTAIDENGDIAEEPGRSEPIRMPDIYHQSGQARKENAAVAELIAQKGAVLLKNENEALPLSENDLSEKGNIALVGLGAGHAICGYGQERSYGTLNYMKSPADALKEYSGQEECFHTHSGIDLVGSVIPSEVLSVDEDGLKKGLTRYYGINETDGYRPPLGVGGAGEEFTGVASRDEDEDDEDLDFKPMDLFMPGNDAADMEGYETGSFCSIDQTVDFTCEPGNQTYKNGKDGKAFVKGEAYTWKGYLLAPEDGEYQLNLQGIGGIAVLKMDVNGSGYKDLGLVKMREGTQWPWGNLVCTPEGMQICATRLHLKKGRRYPIMIYAKGLLELKDLQLRLAWVTPSTRRMLYKEAIEAAEKAEKTIYFIHSGFQLNYGQAFGGLSFGEGIDLELEQEQKELLLDLAKAAHSHGGQLIVAAYNGSAFAMGPWIDQVDALIYMWMPGQSGGSALARLLLGQAVPGGKLPQSFPENNEDTLITDTPEHQKERWEGIDTPGQPKQVYASEGIYTGYRWYDQCQRKPLFEFGFGLSYTRFTYSDLRIERQPDGIVVRLDVKNIGKVAGDEIVQIYISGGEVPAHVMIAQKQLCGFCRLEDIAPEEIREAKIIIPERSLMYWDIKADCQKRPDGSMDKWQYAGGSRKILAGASSQDIRLEAEILIN